MSIGAKHIAKEFSNVLGADAHERLTDNIAEHIACAQEFIREQAIANFASADVNYGWMIRDKVKDITARLKKDVDNFLQGGEFFRNVLGANARERLTDNIAEHIACAQEFIWEQAIANFASADVNYGWMICNKVKNITPGLKKNCPSIAAITSLNCSDSWYLPLLILVQALSQ